MEANVPLSQVAGPAVECAQGIRGEVWPVRDGQHSEPRHQGTDGIPHCKDAQPVDGVVALAIVETRLGRCYGIHGEIIGGIVGYGGSRKAFLGQIASPDNGSVCRNAEVERTFHGRHLRRHGLSRSRNSREIENERQA